MRSFYFNGKIWLLLGPVILGLIILFTKAGLVYDEPWYYENVLALNQKGLTHDFILHLKGPPGPLHACIYYPIYKLFSVSRVFAFRLFGFIMSLISIYILSLATVKDSKIGKNAYLIFACPVFYVVSGLALTEVPSLLFFSLCLLTLSKIKIKNESILLWILSGILLSISICGRQPAIMLLPAVLLSYVYVIREHLIKEYKRLFGIFLFFIFTCILPFILFYIWHGIVPKIGGQDATRESFSFVNGLLGLGYLVVFVFFMFPNIILTEIKRRYLLLIGSFVLVNIANIFIFKQEFYFVNSVAAHYLSPYFLKIYGLLGFSTLICLSVLSLFLFNSLFLVCKNDFFKLSCLLGLYFITLTCLKVTHQFSSRYVYQGIFLIFPILSGINKTSKFTITVNFIGFVLGLLSYLSYLQL